jgi:hypothetical protein
MTYDLNGTPQAIYFMNGNEIRYTYSAAGEKLRVRYYVAVPNVTREFGESESIQKYFINGGGKKYRGIVPLTVFNASSLSPTDSYVQFIKSIIGW